MQIAAAAANNFFIVPPSVVLLHAQRVVIARQEGTTISFFPSSALMDAPRRIPRMPGRKAEPGSHIDLIFSPSAPSAGKRPLQLLA
jgi:hypothetical protein